jgi:hypothetical protein
MSSSPIIDGSTSPRFGVMADRFRRNFTDHGEIGAALCVFHRGEMVVDLWGGVRDEATGARWEAAHDGAGVFHRQGTVVAHRRAGLVPPQASSRRSGIETTGRGSPARGRIERRSPISFRTGPGWCCSAGPSPSTCLPIPGPRSRVMEEMKPLWPPGHRWGYHLATFGELVAELLRRSDPRGPIVPADLRTRTLPRLSGLPFTSACRMR